MSETATPLIGSDPIMFALPAALMRLALPLLTSARPASGIACRAAGAPARAYGVVPGGADGPKT